MNEFRQTFRVASKRQILGVIFFGGCACFTSYLGVWQLQRRNWKQNLINERTKRLNEPPISMTNFLREIPSNEEKWKETYFHRVSCVGRFIHRDQILVGPRSPPQSSSSFIPKINDNRSGYYVITPFELKDGPIILVNRGWIYKGAEELGHFREKRVSKWRHKSNFQTDTSKKPLKHPKSYTEIIGVIRGSESLPPYVSMAQLEKTKNSEAYFYLHLDRIAKELASSFSSSTRLLNKLLPTEIQSKFVVDMIEPVEQTKPFPIRKNLAQFTEFSTTPQIHAVYAATWFSLSSFLFYGTYNFFKKIKI